MKNIFYILILLLFTTATQAQNIPSYVPTNGLVGWWPFNGNANDESGNGNNGIVNGATLTTDRFGNQNGAFLSNSNSTNSILGSCANFPSGNSARTVSVWYNASGLGLGCCKGLFGYGGGNGCGTSFLMYFDHIGDGIGKFETQGHCQAFRQQVGYPLPANSNWYNVIVSYDANSVIKIYFNGQLVNTSTPTSLNTNVNGKIFNLLGEVVPSGDAPYYDSHWTPFNGKVDDIAIYNRDLTQQEIIQLYTGNAKTISTCSDSNGSINPMGNTLIFANNSQSYTFIPNTGYKVDSVLVNGIKVDSTTSYTFSNVIIDQSIRVTFTPIVYTINTQSNSNGNTNPKGNINVNYGSNQRVTITPNAGYYADSVMVDDIQVDSITVYTFSNVTANHSLRVVFKMKYNNPNYTTNSTSTPNSSNQFIVYQAYARNNTGVSLTNKSIQLKFNLLTDSINGSVVFAESHTLSTNAMGLFTAEIGNGTPIQGTWQNINWSASKKFLKTEIDMGSGFVNMGTQQLLAVPFAIHSNTSNTSTKSQTIENADLPIFKDNAAAIYAGLKPGQLYRTASGDLKIVY